MANRNYDDLTIAYLLKKVTASVNSAWQAAVSAINSTIASIQSSMVTTSDYPITIAHGGTGQTGISSGITSSVTAASGYSISVATIRKWGKVVQIIVAAKKTTAVTTSSDLTVGTVTNSAYRPVIASSLVCSDTTSPFGYIDSGGDIHVFGTWSANVTKYMYSTYLLP